MPNWLRGGEERKDHESQRYFGEIVALRQHVSNTVEMVYGISANLSDRYSAEALMMISQRFEEIGREYMDQIILVGHSLYEVTHRSRSRLNAARKVAQQAKSIAQLFEKYARNPKSYSAVNSRFQINKLRGELRNLEAYCTLDAEN